MLNTPFFDDAFSRLEAQAHEAATGRNNLPEPTPAQAQAGNYKMGRVLLHGLQIRIENVRNSLRYGVSADGKAWSNRMAAHYGYFAGTRGADGDGVDVFVGPFPESTSAWVINQGGQAGAFDEHKVMLGFHSEEQARNAYLASYSPGWDGLMSVTPASLPQLKWWLRHGDKAGPLTADQLPHEGNAIMDKVLWSRDAAPITSTLPRILYALRSHDASDGLMLDALTMPELLADPDLVPTPMFDALNVEVGLLKRKMTQIQTVMQAASDVVKPTDFIISDPVKAKGVLQIAVIFSMTDGQSITIWFHNPDTTPNKLTPMDMLVSWKWLLNKKDVTIVVAPERGRDLNVREVARRIMRLVEKNSEGFKKANANAAERAAQTTAITTEITVLEARSAELDTQIAQAQADRVERERLAAMPKAVSIEEVVDVMDRFGKEAGAWTDPEVSDILASAQAQGWVKRMSVTQVQWTEAGADLARKVYQDRRDASAAAPSSAEDAVEIGGNELGDFPDTDEGRKAMRAKLEEHLMAMRGDLVDCPILGDKVEIRRRGIKETIAFSGDPRKMRIAAAVKDVIRLATSSEELENFKKGKKPGVLKYFVLRTPVMLAGVATPVKVVIEQDAVGKLYYDLMIEAGLAPKETAPKGAESVPTLPPNNDSGNADALIVDQVAKEVNEATGGGVMDDAGAGMPVHVAEVLNIFFEGESSDVAASDGDHPNLLPVVDNRLPAERWADDLAQILREQGFAAYSDARSKVAAEQGLDATQELNIGRMVEGIVGPEFMTLARAQHDPYTQGQKAWHRDESPIPPEGLSDDQRTQWLAGWDERQANADASKPDPVEPTPPVEVVDDDAGVENYAPFDMAQIKMPTAVQLGINILNKAKVWEGEDGQVAAGWTNGFILDVAGRPPVVAKGITKYLNDTATMPRVPTDRVDRLVTTTKANADEATPIAFDNTESVTYSTQGEKRTPTDGVILANADQSDMAIINRYALGYFVKSYKGCAFYIGDAPAGLVLVKQHGEVVGVIAPIKSDDKQRVLGLAKRAITRAEIEATNPIAQVDAAYKFDQATDRFKDYVADTVGEADYSMFATAKAMDQAAKGQGANISWDVEEVAGVMDSVEAEPAEDGGLFDDAGTPAAVSTRLSIVGRISKDGQEVGFTMIGGDGRASLHRSVDGATNSIKGLFSGQAAATAMVEWMLIPMVVEEQATPEPSDDAHDREVAVDAAATAGYSAAQSIGGMPPVPDEFSADEDLRAAFLIGARRWADEQQPEPPAEDANVAVLRQILAGSNDDSPLALTLDTIESAVNALNEAGLLVGDIDQLAQDAITHWAILDEKVNG